MMKEEDVICLKCRHEFTSSSKIKNISCPQCNSSDLSMHLKLFDNIDVKDCIRGKIKNDNFPSKKKLRVDFIEGSEENKSNRKWMCKKRIIDKKNNNYEETVIDQETGEIVHQCKESLPDHINHGSAKNKKINNIA